MSEVECALMVSPWPGGEFFVGVSALSQNGEMPYAVLPSESALLEFVAVKMGLSGELVDDIMLDVREGLSFTRIARIPSQGLDAIRQNHHER